MPFTGATDDRVIRSITLKKLIRTHTGNERDRVSSNTTIEGEVGVTVTERAAGDMTDQELYEAAESLLSSSMEIQLEENQELLKILSQAKT